jgi:hypothetical protein
MLSFAHPIHPYRTSAHGILTAEPGTGQYQAMSTLGYAMIMDGFRPSDTSASLGGFFLGKGGSNTHPLGLR